jgi:histone H3/H4
MARTKSAVTKHGSTGPVGKVGKTPGERKKYRFHPGTQALRAIRKLQGSTKLLTSYASVNRVVRGIVHDVKPDMRVSRTAVEILRVGMEQFVHGAMVGGMNVSVAAGKKTLQRRHFVAAHLCSGDPFRQEAADVSMRARIKDEDAVGGRGAPTQHAAL